MPTTIIRGLIFLRSHSEKDEIIEQILSKQKNNIITLMEEKRDVKSLKLILKKLKLNKYYKYSYFILNKLFDVELLKLSPYIEYNLI